MRDQRLQTSAKLLMAGRGQEAERLLLDLLQDLPDSPDGWHLLGLAALHSGDYSQALERLQQAVALSPHSADYHYNLAGAWYALGQWQQAAVSYQHAIDLSADFFEAWKGMGAAHLKLGATAQAERALRKALHLNSKNPLVWVDLADAMVGQDRFTEAIEVLQQALRVQEDCLEAHLRLADLFHRTHNARNEATAYYNLGSLFWRQGRHSEAKGAFERSLALNPHNGRAQHGLATLRGETPKTAPREYVVDLFDKYAMHFDSHLALLQYRVPELMREAIHRQNLQRPNPPRVIDLGCGSGKGGKLMRDLAAHLCGIDLSPQMIEHSRNLAIYDELVLGDITEVLRGRTDTFDIILAADVFIYVGALEELFEQCRRLCSPGGLFLFSVESYEGSGYTLRPSGRFAHSQDYIQALAAQHRFALIAQDPVAIRKQQEGPIPGWLCVLKKN